MYEDASAVAQLRSRAAFFFPPHFAARQAWDLDAEACHTIIKELDPKMNEDDRPALGGAGLS